MPKLQLSINVNTQILLNLYGALSGPDRAPYRLRRIKICKSCNLTVRLHDLHILILFLSFLLHERTEETCSITKTLHVVDFSHPTGHYTYMKNMSPPL